MLALQLAVDHGQTGRPHGVLLHLLAQHGHLVLGELHPRRPLAAGTRIGRRWGQLGQGIAGRDAGNGAVDIRAGHPRRARTGLLRAVLVCLRLSRALGEADPAATVVGLVGGGVAVHRGTTSGQRHARLLVLVAGGVESQVQARAVVGALDGGRDGRRCRVARRRLWLSLQLALDDGGALTVAHRDLVQPRCLCIRILALVDGLLQLLRDLLAQECRVGALPLGQLGQLAVQRRQLVHLLHRIRIRRIEVADQRQAAHQVRRVELGVVEEVIHRRLRIRVGRGRRVGVGGSRGRIFSVGHGASRSRGVSCVRGGRCARQTLQPRVDAVGGGNRGGASVGEGGGRQRGEGAASDQQAVESVSRCWSCGRRQGEPVR